MHEKLGEGLPQPEIREKRLLSYRESDAAKGAGRATGIQTEVEGVPGQFYFDREAGTLKTIPEGHVNVVSKGSEKNYEEFGRIMDELLRGKEA